MFRTHLRTRSRKRCSDTSAETGLDTAFGHIYGRVLRHADSRRPVATRAVPLLGPVTVPASPRSVILQLRHRRHRHRRHHAAAASQTPVSTAARWSPSAGGSALPGRGIVSVRANRARNAAEGGDDEKEGVPRRAPPAAAVGCARQRNATKAEHVALPASRGAAGVWTSFYDESELFVSGRNGRCGIEWGDRKSVRCRAFLILFYEA